MTVCVQGGTLFDGLGGLPVTADVLVGDDGTVVAIGPNLEVPEGTDIVDASGCWVTPGFVDLHTHYDAELEVAPALSESLRHGVTTVLIGSCGLSLVGGEPEDLADMFCRVEGLPHDHVLAMLSDVMDWNGPAQYAEHLAGLPLGPNVVAMAGHSTIRAQAMGLERSVSRSARPTESELGHMERLVDEGLDAGMLGVSVNLLPWDKMGGTRFRSRPTPSVFAKFAEYRRLADVVRRREAVFQAIPNLQTRWSFGPLLAMGRPQGGKTMRTSLLTLLDAPPAMGAYKVLATAAQAMNDKMGADIRFQALPTPFDLYTDGIENPVFEELGAGTEALHLQDPVARQSLWDAPPFRARFARQWSNKLAARAYHRDLSEAVIISAPDAALAGQTFAQVAKARGVSPIDAFMDLQRSHGNELRWYSVVANADRPAREWIMNHPAAVMGFSDAGAHLRNMAFYNFPLRMLKAVRDAQAEGRPFMTVERAVQRLTSEIAHFLGIDAGTVAVGRRADIVVVDPNRLDESVDEIHEESMAEFDGLSRLVRRNDATVRAVMVGGSVAWTADGPAAGLGSERRFGTYLPFDSAVR